MFDGEKRSRICGNERASERGTRSGQKQMTVRLRAVLEGSYAAEVKEVAAEALETLEGE